MLTLQIFNSTHTPTHHELPYWDPTEAHTSTPHTLNTTRLPTHCELPYWVTARA
ncbi:hypothetical protein PAXRUDRAFT_20821 [Paxillus rubicundulus Ve08.2h10]|uniref:Uncharacterized protein n=1 Tax=Paxillus rubicundulus Ve08.2h10 TaxID=930991 RepID=A0A0D0CD79_9AGAM|nr:hypothetical protein PAXRUDRAFT_20821 [Paxillus rubicundulus Ve08.2h10]